MSAETESLRELYRNVADDEVLTDAQEEDPSRDPIDETVKELEETVSEVTQQSGLTGALEGGEETD